MFQFLIGTLKTQYNDIFLYPYHQFQFLIGTLKTGQYGGGFAGVAGFNSSWYAENPLLELPEDALLLGFNSS